jgi:hypothetical protein
MRGNEKTLREIRDSVAFVGRMSDGILRLGPFSIGIDGVLSWIPWIGDAYSLLAGAFIIIQGIRAGVGAPTLMFASLLLGVRTLAGSVPLAGSAFADLFTAHRWAASMIVRAIDRRLGLYVHGDAAWSAGRAPA